MEGRDGLPREGKLGLREPPTALDFRAKTQHNALLDDLLERKRALPGDEKPGGVATEIDDSDSHESYSDAFASRRGHGLENTGSPSGLDLVSPLLFSGQWGCVYRAVGGRMA